MSRRAAAAPGCETHDMVLVHRVFRREFRLLADIVEATAPTDTEQVTRVSAHAREMLAALHHYHRYKDELILPKLRSAELDSTLLDRIQTQHGQIDALMRRVDSELSEWEHQGGAETADLLVEGLRRLHAELTEHLRLEEDSVLPIVAETLTASEWAELGKRGMASFSRGRALVFLGHIAEEADEREWSEFVRAIPAPVRLLYRVFGRRGYARETALLRRDLRTVGKVVK
ncbi:hemerythrin domain-containing protein [Nocardia anaemiae]|uniref:hemerythrin domain-containing protein n=1 Tax=Nocardia anaemiae TaxID=263910 RepID=UPI0007A458F4|nr:hemerythrin domain-containing protein [Nocardia anaemiae]